jgi:biotin transport system substrate-specific component
MPKLGLQGSLWQTVFFVLLGTAAMTIAAKIQVPIAPVKISMQSFVCILLGCMYGPRLGALTMIAYVCEGALGLPVFQGTPEKGLGLAYMMGPTGGYLLGFVLSATVAGWLSNRGWGKTIASALGLFALASWTLDVCGLAWLSSLLGKSTAWGVWTSYQWAFVLKAGLFAGLYPLIRRRT